MSDAPLTVRVRRITVVGASGLDARRLADALPRSLERALADERPGLPRRSRGPSAADRAALDIAAAVRCRIEALG